MQTSMTDSEYNLDPNCLSRCSTELFSEASWEQVDKQDTEVNSQANLRIFIWEGGSKVLRAFMDFMYITGHSLVP